MLANITCMSLARWLDQYVYKGLWLDGLWSKKRSVQSGLSDWTPLRLLLEQLPCYKSGKNSPQILDDFSLSQFPYPLKAQMIMMMLELLIRSH